MAHTKSQGSAKRVVNIVGKRRGVKRFGGHAVKAGEIIVRQVGSKFHPGKGAGIGRDFTIFATTAGVVQFRNMTGYHRGQKYIDIVPAEVVAIKDETKTTKAKAVTKAEPKA